MLNFFCFLLPYQINFNCFFGKFIWVNMQIRILIKVLVPIVKYGKTQNLSGIYSIFTPVFKILFRTVWTGFH